MTLINVTTYGPDGKQIGTPGVIDVPDNPTPDLPTIASQVTQLTDAVNLLILTQLGI